MVIGTKQAGFKYQSNYCVERHKSPWRAKRTAAPRSGQAVRSSVRTVVARWQASFVTS